MNENALTANCLLSDGNTLLLLALRYEYRAEAKGGQALKPRDAQNKSQLTVRCPQNFRTNSVQRLQDEYCTWMETLSNLLSNVHDRPSFELCRKNHAYFGVISTVIQKQT